MGGTDRAAYRWGVGAIGLGVAYLIWRVGWTISGVPTWLSIPALLVEGFGVAGAGLFVVVLGRRALPASAVTSASWDQPIDVVIRHDSQPLGHLRATLAGVRHLENVGTTTVLCSYDDPEIEAEAEAAGVTLVVLAANDAAGLRYLTSAESAQSTRPVGDLVAILDSGDVPMPSFLVTLGRKFDDAGVAAVQAELFGRGTDSAEHDAHSRHDLAFERTVLLPKLGDRGASIMAGSGAIIRRAALQSIRVPNGPRRSVEMRWSIRVRASGRTILAPAGPLVAATSLNNSNAVRAERRRQSNAAMRAALSSDNPVIARGLVAADRAGYLSLLVRPLAGLRRQVFVVVVLAALLSGQVPFHPSILGMVALWAPWFVLQARSIRQLSAGTLPMRVRSQWSLATMGPSTAAIGGSGATPIGMSVAAARRGGIVGVFTDDILVASLALLAMVTLAAGVDRWFGILPDLAVADQAGLLAVSVWLIGGLLEVMRCLGGPSQLRESRRIDVRICGTLEGLPAVVSDLSPTGAGVLSAVGVTGHLGDMVAMTIEIVSATGSTEVIPVTGIVRNVRPSSAGAVLGVEFTGLSRSALDSLYAYCEVIHPTGELPQVGNIRPTQAFDQATASQPPRRSKLALVLGVTALAGVCSATSPPFSAASAGGLDCGASDTNLVCLDSDNAQVGNPCPDDQSAYWHFALTAPEGRYGVLVLVLSIDGAQQKFEGGNADSVFIRIPDGATAQSLSSYGSYATFSGDGSPTFNLTHLCQPVVSESAQEPAEAQGPFTGQTDAGSTTVPPTTSESAEGGLIDVDIPDAPDSSGAVPDSTAMVATDDGPVPGNTAPSEPDQTQPNDSQPAPEGVETTMPSDQVGGADTTNPDGLVDSDVDVPIDSTWNGTSGAGTVDEFGLVETNEIVVDQSSPAADAPLVAQMAPPAGVDALLPETGSDALQLVVFASSLLLLGMVLLGARRRRPA